MKNTICIFIIFFTFSSCELLDEAANFSPDVVAGLKQALEFGTNNATGQLGLVDGYLKDQAVKILLPDEIEQQISAFKSININILGANISGETLYNGGTIAGIINLPSLASVEDELITGINRAAESAAKEAGPIFIGAITNMTFNDANEILFGDNDAATQFFIDNTYDELFATYEPKLDEAITSVTVGNKSVEDIYASYVNTYNDILDTSIPGLFGSTRLADLAGLSTLSEPNLSAFATEKGLNGLFSKVAKEEKNIRENPSARVTTLLQQVFGLQD